jgi:Ca2+-binding RTX toxin-like protein
MTRISSLAPVVAAAIAFGDVFASLEEGRVNHYDGAGKFIETLHTGQDATETGCGFDSSGNLYVTDFDTSTISKFDREGKLLGLFGSGIEGSPESIVFDGSGHAYVGTVDGDGDVRKFDADGKPLGHFDVAIEDRGSDWIDLAADQCTLFYTSEGECVKRFDVCKNEQLTDFTCALPTNPAFALRLLGGGGLLVANATAIRRLDGDGKVVQEYDVSDEDGWFALSLDPDGTSFWSASTFHQKFYKFDIASGDVLVGPVATGSQNLDGLCVFGEITAANESICNDGQDNDGDSQIDCEDEDCDLSPACKDDIQVKCRREATIVGTNGDDVLRGTPGPDIIHGRQGNDLIRGLGGKDILCGGMGRDTLLGGAGRDMLHGGSGKDLLKGGTDRDTMNGGPGQQDQCIDTVDSVFSPECEN